VKPLGAVIILAVPLAILVGGPSPSSGNPTGSPSLLSSASTSSPEEIRALLRTGRYAQAEERATLELRDSPRDPELLYLRGESHLRRGAMEEAESDFGAAASAGHLPALYRVGETLAVRGETDGAMGVFDTFIDAYNQGRARTPAELLAVGQAVARLGARDPSLFQDAVRAMEEALRLDPGFHPARVEMGMLFLAKYDSREARALFGEVLRSDPEHPGALMGMAEAALFDRAGDATEHARAALETNPSLVQAHVLLGRAALESEDRRAALEALEDALDVNPRDLPALTMRAAADFLADDTAGWRAARDRVLDLSPGYADLYATVGELAVQVRRYEDAVRMGRSGVSLDSISWRSWGLLGINQLRLGDMGGGRESLERAFAGDPYNVWYKNTLDLLDELDRYVEVETEHFLLVLHPDEAEFLAPLAEALAEEAFDSLSTRYGMAPPLPIRVEFFPRHADFSVRTLGLPGLGALGVSFGSVLTMDSPAARRRGEFNWGATFWHETAHAFHLAYTDHRIPRWFAEGMAVLEERRSRPGWGHELSLTFLLALEADRIRPVSDLNSGFLRPSYPNEVPVSYYVASLVCEYIETNHGFDAILAFLDGYRSGRTTEDLVGEILHTRPGAFDREFASYLEDRFGGYLGDRSAPSEEEAEAGAFHGMSSGGDRAALEETLRRDPDDGLANLGMGTLLANAGSEEEALPFLRRALEVMPEYGGPDAPHLLLARIHRSRGETAPATRLLTDYARLNATNEEAFTALSDLLADSGDLPGATRALERNLWVHPYDPALLSRLATLAEEAGDRDRVVEARRALVALDPVDRSQALYDLAVAQRDAGDTAAARSTVLQALEIAPGFEAALELLLELRGGGE
jgi:tetratricopeptide (TPR) repeat protein